MMMTCIIRGAHWIAAFVLLIVVPASTAQDIAAPVDPVRLRNMCGPNSLFLFLRLHDVTVSVGEVMKYASPNPEGMSLLELKKACADCGLRTEVTKCTPLDLRQIRYPAIARVHHAAGAARGHYVVLTGLKTDDQIQAIDGTTSEMSVYQISRMSAIWEGYILIATDPDDRSVSQIIWISVLIAVACFARWHARPICSAILNRLFKCVNHSGRLFRLRVSEP